MIKTFLRQILPDTALKHASALNHYMWGEEELRLMPRVCRPDRISLDVGANVGTYTYFLSRYSSAVYAFEPNPGLAEHLTRRYPNVHVRNAAVSDAPGHLTLRIPVIGGQQRHALASVAIDFDEDEVVEFDVPAITIDSQNLSNVGFMKIDAEQHELAVLRGALTTIQRSRPNIMTEATPLLYEDDLPTTFRLDRKSVV